ncbi:IgGFc-binding protein-like [Thalassophryne amazonica]|uniref:IgGFc-binding protein-like n=1 Tax=Thalassophryne amazonica TaxID=390379 RepID=UPI0014710353|nr:IgGFc-binding protein-like [Thalassophryne amazonica]
MSEIPEIEANKYESEDQERLLEGKGPSHAEWAGQEFYLSFMQNYAPNYDTPNFHLSITALNQRAEVTVKVPALNFKQERSLKPGEMVTIDLPTGVELFGSMKSSNTVFIEASADVAVTSLNCKQYTSDTSVVYPVTEWGTEYYIFTPAISPGGTFKEFSVTNGKEKNTVQVFPQSQIIFEGRNYQPGTTIVIELQPYQSVQLQSTGDLSGSRIATQHPVAVFSGHTCTWRFSTCDHVYEQLLPVSRWGTNFIVSSVNFQNQFDSVYIQASQNTQVKVQNGQHTDVMSLVKGQVKEIQSRYPEILSIQADNGIQVLLLFNGVKNYDPFLMTIVPTNRFCSSYSLEALNGFINQAMLVAKDSEIAQLRVNGEKLSHDIQWQKVAGTNFMWTQIELLSSNKQYTVTSSGSSFGLYSIGFKYAESYGSPAQCLQPEVGLGTCWAMGDPHYQTFDGHRYDFMGTCTYVISKKCAADSSLPDFEVIAQNENRGSLRVSYVALVTVKVYGYDITVVRTEKGHVRIDNSLWSLPITLNNDNLMIFQSGRYVVIQTTFGLTVKYDWVHALVVTLSKNYAGMTCGLCGNFNGNPKDDFATPSGPQAGSAVEFGGSWKVPGLMNNDNCRDDCVGGCESCEHDMMKIWEGDTFCGLITLVLNGPFSQCHSVIDPQAYLENCKYDICMGGGLQQFLCRALEDYMDACQSAGIEVLDWRNTAKCPGKCPANSHYELCGNACPATCTDPNAPAKCIRPCVETCTCNTGYVLSGDRCVPAAQCGCTYEGRYVPAGETFWPDKDCRKQCKCVAETRLVECQDKGCRAEETCQVIDGIRKCHPVSQSTCQATGDPHYTTFDNNKFDFQGTCVYQLVAVCSKVESLVPFEVLVQNDHRGSNVVSFTKLVEVKVYSLSIVISKNYNGRIMINGELVNLPITLSEGQVSVFKSGYYAVVTTSFGLKVSFDWRSAVFVTLPSIYRGTVCGLCGNYNGKPQDDLIPKNGDKVAPANEFGTSWKVAEIPGCVDGCKGVCPDCDKTEKVKYETGDFCGILKDPKGPFRDCHAKVNPDNFFEDCVFDACIYKGRKDVLCQAIMSYSSSCQDVGAKLYSWRTKEFCEMDCPVHAHYELCGPACPATCKSLAPPQGCQAHCEEGCSCDEGYILSGDQCVPFSDCGCEYDDQYYSIGQVFYPNGNCQEECTCKKGGEVECKKFSCGPNEKCMIKYGVQKCHPVEPGTCWSMGDPHYLTFDGRRYDFMGTCTYVISKKCATDSQLPDFEVIAQNENRGSLRVSYVALVTVKVYGYDITVVRTEKGHVRIDNSLWSLPITLNNDNLMIFQSGRYVVIQTTFGLTVKYDWVHALVVTLSKNYAGMTCGLCGNFNGNPKDDFATPSGPQAGSAVEFGGSWKVPGLMNDDNCRDDCVGGCESCEHDMMKIWEGDTFCGLITLVLNGPFSQCHSVIDPQAYLENCKYDICMGGGLQQFLCRALEDYMDACQSAGIEVLDWRNTAKCPGKCPANSHYELCGNACPATCTDPNAPAKCIRPCVETCTCNTGYVLSGDRCVPAAQCGCTYEGRYVPAGETFWPDKDCRKQCKCVAETRLVECQDKGCRAEETCQVIDGIRKCHPVSQSTCQATGDPHYTTFDNNKFDFQGTCVYQLVAVCSKVESLVPFEVLVQNDHRGSNVVSFTKLVEVKVYSLSIVISKNHNGRIMINGELVNLPITLSEGQVSVFKSGYYAVVTTSFGLKVSFDWRSAVFVTLPSIYRGTVCGLCGNYNGKPQDDLIPKNGDKVAPAKEFGTSWKVAEIPGCVDGCKGVCPDCDKTEKVKYETGDFCGILKDPKGPFRDCHAKVNQDNFFEDCVFDACIYKGRKDVLCQAITSYSSACQDVGAKLYSWRTKEFCEMDCPVHTHYELCGPACPATCKSLAPPQGCQAHCEEGCSCDEGYILSGDQCVPFSDCGCEYDDQYYSIGQVFYPNGNCQEECTCKKDGEVECKTFSCGHNEKCMIKDGVQKCHPVVEGVCYASCDSHFLSFDGFKFDFHGTCTYTLSKSCNLEGSHLLAFSVQLQNAQWAHIKTKEVAVDVYGFSLIFKNTMFGVLVNGIVNHLPINLNDGAVQIYQHGTKYVIQTDFGLRVTTDLFYHVSVTVPGNYQNKVCGLCGNFNGNNRDDFQMPNGQLAENGNMFGKSWMADIPNVWCQNGCEGNMCPVCEPAWKDVLSKPTYCGIITAPEGPFAPCHSKVNPQSYFDDCVFDVCVFNGDWKVLCDSVAAYAFHCHMAGVDIKNWRTPSFCPMKCPANSHYEVCADSCSTSCLGLTEIVQCSTSCTEGCECDAGFLFDGQTCVKDTECGCYDNGKTYKLGQAEVDKECKSKCVCQESGEMKCAKLTCAAEEVCTVQDGVQDCHVKQGYCTVSPGGYLTSFDGMSGGVGGPGAFQLASLCDEDTALWFRVVVDVRVCSHCAAKQVVTVFVYLNNTSIIVNKDHLVWVNGKKVSLPKDLTSELSIHISDMTVTIEWASALRVTYSSQEVTVIVHHSLSGKTCGACGNYNNDAKDDMRTAGGKSTTDVAMVTDSWNAEEISRCGL